MISTPARLLAACTLLSASRTRAAPRVDRGTVVDTSGSEATANAASDAALALGWPLVDHTGLLGRVGSPPPAVERRKELEAARTLYEQAARRLVAADVEGSLQDLAAADGLLGPAPPVREEADLRRAFAFLRGRALSAVPERAGEADAAYREAARLDPEAVVQPGEYPPEVIAAYEHARRAVFDGPRARLRVTTAPEGATLRIDGRDVGHTPALLELPPGTIRMRLLREGYQSVDERRALTAGYAEIAIVLRPAPRRERAAVVAARLAAGAAPDADGLAWLADQLDARRALFVREANGRIEAFLLNGDALHRLPTAAPGQAGAGERIGQAARVLLAAGKEGARPAPWYLRPWLWGAVGAAVGAGLGAGGFWLVHEPDGTDVTVRTGPSP